MPAYSKILLIKKNLNINTKKYWNQRFASGNWKENGGVEETIIFAESQIPRLKLSKEFSGTILDFGCALGDAIPVLKNSFPKAKFIGIDFSQSAIEQCIEKHGDIADFIVGTYVDVPDTDIIISSNVFEHLSNDKEIVKFLKNKCKELYTFTPYNERINAKEEHVNSYTLNYFKSISKNYTYEIFKVKGYAPSFLSTLYNIYFKNIFRRLVGIQTLRPVLQIMYVFKNHN